MKADRIMFVSGIMKSVALIILFVAVIILTVNVLLPVAQALEFVKSPPLESVISSSVEDVKNSTMVKVPVITWGGDMATILANGNAVKSVGSSIFGQKGLNLELVRVDSFKKQVEDYIKGDSPYLRGTMGMINMAAPLLSKSPATKPIIIYQMTWSNGGDCLVVKQGIKTAKDLKGKTVALQAYGPHVEYLATIIKDAGLTPDDITIRWTKDLTGSSETPAEAFALNSDNSNNVKGGSKDRVDAAFVIIPDGLMLTSNGTVGTGSEGSVKGARIMLSTRTANRVIADVYAVRSDYLASKREEVKKFVHGLMLAEQAIRPIFKNRAQNIEDYKQVVTASAEILFDSRQATADAEALYGDVEFAGFKGNVEFFANTNWSRNMANLNREIGRSFAAIGLISSAVPVDHAMWDYNDMKTGLAGISDIAVPRFKSDEVARVVAKKQSLGTLDEGELFSFEINFDPNQKEFSDDLYSAQFAKVVELAATYGGAIITVEGHSDPLKYNKMESQGANSAELKRVKQAAKNLSLSRALAVRNSIQSFAGSRNVPLDDSQLTVVGHGISMPKYPSPSTKEEWLQNMRVVFRIIQVEAEESVFEPFN
ncbi:MAG: ABC transporter substrate-binding protein [Desulfamplus sp.]|nr:ABC transporter substrate-binding protein [Desulfamplus sp.]